MVDGPRWKGQRPWFEIWFAVILDEIAAPRAVDPPDAVRAEDTATRAPRSGARGSMPTRSRRPAPPSAREPIERLKLGEGDALIRIDDSTFARAARRAASRASRGTCEWSGGTPVRGELPAWLPAPTHARAIVARCRRAGHRDGRRSPRHECAAARSRCTCGASAACRRCTGSGRRGSATARSRSPRSRCAIGSRSGCRRCSSTGPTRSPAARRPRRIRTASSPRPSPARAGWSTRARGPSRREMVGYAYRDTDNRDSMVAQSDIGSAHVEVFTRTRAGRAVEARRGAARRGRRRRRDPPAHAAARGRLPRLGRAEAARARAPCRRPRRPTTSTGRRSRAIVALGLTYADHVARDRPGVDPRAPPVAFEKHAAHVRRAATAASQVPASAAIAPRSTSSSPASAPSSPSGSRSCPR